MSSREGITNVCLPNSHIRQPGTLFKDKKEPFEVRANQEIIHTLLGCFKTEIDSPFTSFADLQCDESIPAIPSTDRPRMNYNSKTLLEKFLKSQSMESTVSPGKLKTLSDKICNLTQKAKDILSVYDLELVVQDTKISKEVYNLFKALVPEICFFPSNFFQKLQIKKIFICKSRDESFRANNFSLSISSLDTKQKVRQRLYEIIFNRIIETNSEIITKWSESDLVTSISGSSGDSKTKMEELFISLMENTNHSLSKTESRRLRELLAVYYPEAMSEERFKQRNKDRKKGLKVRFDTEPSAL